MRQHSYFIVNISFIRRSVECKNGIEAVSSLNTFTIYHHYMTFHERWS